VEGGNTCITARLMTLLSHSIHFGIINYAEVN
jgi:hypothetical protein